MQRKAARGEFENLRRRHFDSCFCRHEFAFSMPALAAF